ASDTVPADSSFWNLRNSGSRSVMALRRGCQLGTDATTQFAIVSVPLVTERLDHMLLAVHEPRTCWSCRGAPSRHGGNAMTRGDKDSYTDKQKRQAEHIEKSEKKEGKSKEDAERIAWATVNKQDGGGKKSGSGRDKD